MKRLFAGIALLSLLAPQLSARETNKTYAEVNLAELSSPDPEVWSAPSELDGKKCRLLKAGRRGEIPLTPWWSKRSLRPREGSAFLAEIVFKDTASRPIKVEAFAGLPGRYELHRIGGLADGKWKTALVPVPWDMIMRMPYEETDKTALYITAPPGEDIPVASVTITKGDPEQDEARWEEETRAWVARVQKEKREKARQPSSGDPVIPPQLRSSPIVPFTRRTTGVIYDNDAPRKGEAGAPIEITMALNEIEPGQFGVFANGRDLENVRISLEEPGLKGPRGLLRAKVELFTAEYSVVTSGKLFPQRLWPAYPVDIPKGRSHMFWLNVETKGRGVRPGRYSGAVRIEADGLPPTRIPLKVKVLPIRLLSMKEAGLHMGGCTKGLLPAHELKELVRHNMNSINLWYYGFEPRIIRKSGSDFDLDFTIQDDFMRHAREAGIENFVYFLGGNPYGWPDTIHLVRELYRMVYRDGSDLMGYRLELLKKMCAKPGPLPPEVRPLYVEWVRKFMEHAQKARWPEPFLTPFDEPAKWVQGNWARARLYYYKENGRDHVEKVRERDLKKFLARMKQKGVEPMFLGVGGADTWIKDNFKDSCAAIHEGWPKARVYASIHHAKPGLVFLPDVEIFCTNAIDEDPELGDKVRAEAARRPEDGVTFWQYSGTRDDRLPSEGRYTFGFYFAAFDSRGSLCWAYNWGARFDTSSGNNWLYGWTTPYSVVRTPFWEGMREAWDDRRYIETLKYIAKRRRAEKRAEALLNSIYDEAVASRTAEGRDKVNDFFARTKDTDALDAMRARVAGLILELLGR